MTAETIIATRSLTKRYKEVAAVDGLDLDVRQGEVYGFLAETARARRSR